MSTEYPASCHQREPWNKGRLVGQKRPLKPKDVWTLPAICATCASECFRALRA